MNSNSFSERRGLGRGRGSGRGNRMNDRIDPNVSVGRGRGRGRGSSIISNNYHNDSNLVDRSRGRGRGHFSRSSWMEPLEEDFQKPMNETNNEAAGERMEQIRIHKEEKEADIRKQKELEEQMKLEEEEELQLQQILQEATDGSLNKLGASIDDKDDDDTFSAFFTSKQAQEEESANERRARRKARLKELSKVEELKNNDDTILNNKETNLGDKKRGLESFSEQANDNNNMDDDELSSKRQKIENDNRTNHNASNKNNDDDGNNSFDMFASTSPIAMSPFSEKKDTINNTAIRRGDDNDEQNYNDADGYYKATIGEIISFTSQEQGAGQKANNMTQNNTQFKVLGIVGKGVFSTVLKCTRMQSNNEDNPSLESKPAIKDVAMKLIRSNDIMTKAAEKEVRILRMLRASSKDHSNNHFIVRMLELEDFEEESSSKLENTSFHKHIPSLEYRNHTALLFEYIPNNLRQVLSKFGKNVGINLSSVKSYAKQLLLALKHLSSHGIIHADIKLDNILVTSNWTSVKLCDFGSAFLESDEEYINHMPTPYLVSRFYRAPEIILGLKYDKMIDLWSVAVSLAELFTGNVFFAGRTNNDMIKRFMDSIGPFSNKMIRRHISAYEKVGLKPHFEVHAGGGGNFDFRRQDIDKVTGKPIIRIASMSQNQNVAVASKQISQIILKSRSGSDNRGEVVKFAGFLNRCLALDPGKRISMDEALKHEFLK